MTPPNLLDSSAAAEKHKPPVRRDDHDHMQQKRNQKLRVLARLNVEGGFVGRVARMKGLRGVGVEVYARKGVVTGEGSGLDAVVVGVVREKPSRTRIVSASNTCVCMFPQAIHPPSHLGQNVIASSFFSFQSTTTQPYAYNKVLVGR